jgi:hypothetical protein
MLLTIVPMQGFFESTMERWIEMNMLVDMGRGLRDNWAAFWETCHFLWCWRNKSNHDGFFLPSRPWRDVITRDVAKGAYMAKN